MARLTAAERRALPASAFAGRNRTFPVNDRSHAEKAKAFALVDLKARRISKAEYDRIVAKANKVLYGKKGPLSRKLRGA